MSTSHPHWLRSAIIAVAGLIIALGSVLWVGIAIRSVGPKTISLVYRIEEKTTLAFVRSTQEEKFLETIGNVRRFFPSESRIDLPALPKGVSYEYALLSGSGSQHWIVVVHTRNQEQVMFESSAEAGAFLLPIDRIGASIGVDEFFRAHGGQKSSDCAFIDLENTRRADDTEPIFLRLALSAFSHALFMEEEKGERKLILRKHDPSLPLLSGTAPAIIGTGSGHPLLSLSIGHPALLLGALQNTDERAKDGLAEGILGILQFRLTSLTQSSDLKQAIDDLTKNGLGITLTQRNEGTATLLTMKGRNNKAIDEWWQRMQSTATPAMIRTQTFLHGNSRTDVIHAPMQERRNAENDWTLMTTNSGTQLPLSFAMKDAMLLFSNDKTLLSHGMRDIDHMTSDREQAASIKGTIDIGWLLKTLKQGSRLLPSLQKHAGAQVVWEANDNRETVDVRYRLER